MKGKKQTKKKNNAKKNKQKTVKKQKSNLKREKRKKRKINKSSEPKEEEKNNNLKISWQTLRGMRDILPEEWVYWDYFLTRAKKIAEAYGYQYIETPILEEAVLYQRSTGLSSDIVTKQMYDFKDKSGKTIVLRPEVTPSIARAYIEHGLFDRPQPVKLYYFGPNFRYERPQAGRYRQFYQFGLEILGSSRAASDAELIILSRALFEDLGIKVFFQINSIGCPNCRSLYRKKLIKFLKSKEKLLCPDCQRRYRENPLRVLDCKNFQCQKVLSTAPQFVDNLCPDCYKHFTEVLEHLDAANITREINSHLVRGLDYYSRTVFEIFPVKDNEDLLLGPQNSNLIALGGGGRYDNLIEKFSGRNVPALGVSYGVDRIIEELKAQNIRLPSQKKPTIFLAQIGQKASRLCLPLFEKLRTNGFRCAMNLGKESLKAQLEQANNMKVAFTLILGSQEVQDETIIVRNMTNGIQEHVPQDKLISYLKTLTRR